MYYLLQYEGLTRNGRVFDMRGMLPHSEARMRMCVMKVGDRGRWTYGDWLQWHFLWKFFPWYAREMHYRGHFCLGQGCMHWFWENAEKKERGNSDVGERLRSADHDASLAHLGECRGHPADQGAARYLQVHARPDPALRQHGLHHGRTTGPRDASAVAFEPVGEPRLLR